MNFFNLIHCLSNANSEGFTELILYYILIFNIHNQFIHFSSMKNTSPNLNTPSQKVTFETLSSTRNLETEELIINPYPWKNQDFQKIYFEQNKKFEMDEEKLKSGFYEWHKDLGRKLYNINLKKFNFIPLKQTSIEITKFLQFHPLLTQKDFRNLELIRQELKSKYKRHIFTNFCVGMTIILTYLRIKGKRENLTIAVIVKKLYAPLIFAFFMSVVWVDARYRVYKPLYMGEMISEKGMDKKYFIDYLSQVKNNDMI